MHKMHNEYVQPNSIFFSVSVPGRLLLPQEREAIRDIILATDP